MPPSSDVPAFNIQHNGKGVGKGGLVFFTQIFGKKKKKGRKEDTPLRLTPTEGPPPKKKKIKTI